MDWLDQVTLMLTIGRDLTLVQSHQSRKWSQSRGVAAARVSLTFWKLRLPSRGFIPNHSKQPWKKALRSNFVGFVLLGSNSASFLEVELFFAGK